MSPNRLEHTENSASIAHFLHHIVLSDLVIQVYSEAGFPIFPRISTIQTLLFFPSNKHSTQFTEPSSQCTKKRKCCEQENNSNFTSSSWSNWCEKLPGVYTWSPLSFLCADTVASASLNKLFNLTRSIIIWVNVQNGAIWPLPTILLQKKIQGSLLKIYPRLTHAVKTAFI